MTPRESLGDKLDRLGAEAEELEAQGVELREDVKVTRGHGRSKTLQVRLNIEEYDQLVELAESQELPLSTVARAILLEGMTPADDLMAAVRRLERDVRDVRRQVGA